MVKAPARRQLEQEFVAWIPMHPNTPILSQKSGEGLRELLIDYDGELREHSADYLDSPRKQRFTAIRFRARDAIASGQR